MLVFSEAKTEFPRTPSERDNRAMTEAAQLAGFQIYYIPSDFDACETAENALWHAPAQSKPTPAAWIGFIPTEGRYEEMYKVARAKNLYLLNTPEEHYEALEFARSYPALTDLTPETVILNHPDEWCLAAKQLGYPVFVRGSARSRKGAGWTACVAENDVELIGIVNHLFAHPFRSRGNVLVRRLVPLRYVRRTEGGFPVGREFRVFLYRGDVMGFGYYWEGDDPLSHLSANEERVVLALAEQAAARLKAPFLCVDIGQTETGDWIVIEVGDASFAGAGQTPLLPLWQNIRRALEHNKA